MSHAAEPPVRTTEPTSSPPTRWDALDQFRGYTVAGMIVVNFVGGLAAVPAILKHHNTYCSYADTIMPQFFLAVGFAYRWTFLNRLEQGGRRAAISHAWRRNLGLLLVGFLMYGLDGKAKTWADLETLGVVGFLAEAFQRSFFQTLVHIAIASLWVMPVIDRSARVRLAWLVGSCLLHVALSYGFYYDWVMKRPGIDGGPLGFLTWTVPILAGSLAYDAWRACVQRPGRLVGWCLRWGALTMALGYGLSCLNGPAPAWEAVATQETSGSAVAASDSVSNAGSGWRVPPGSWLADPPFMPPSRPVGLWTMSQRAGSVSYLVFSTGFALMVLGICVVASDLLGLGSLGFRRFGQHALVMYLVHGMAIDAVKPHVPKDAPGWYVVGATLVVLGICGLVARHLDRTGFRLKL